MLQDPGRPFLAFLFFPAFLFAILVHKKGPSTFFTNRKIIGCRIFTKNMKVFVIYSPLTVALNSHAKMPVNMTTL